LNSTLGDDKATINQVRHKYDTFVRLLFVSSIHFAWCGWSDYTQIEHDRVTASKVILRADEAGRPS
jgi:hypothetical protein